MSSIFLSHTASDESFVSRLAADLELSGCLIWRDCISHHSDLSFLERMLSSSRRINSIILIFSKSSTSGTIASRDWNDAILDETLHGRNWLIPLMLEDCDLPKYLSPGLVVDFRNLSDYSSSLKELLTRLNVSVP